MDSFLSIQGEVVSVVYENPENGYVIARLLIKRATQQAAAYKKNCSTSLRVADRKSVV